MEKLTIDLNKFGLLAVLTPPRNEEGINCLFWCIDIFEKDIDYTDQIISAVIQCREDNSDFIIEDYFNVENSPFLSHRFTLAPEITSGDYEFFLVKVLEHLKDREIC